MAGSISQQLEDLLNPLPKYADPEDDQDEETKAKIIEFDEDDDGEAVGVSALRKRNTSLLSETDGRYLGKPVSRKQLLEDIGESEDDDDDVDDDDDDEEDEEEDEEEAGDCEEDGMLESGDEVEDEDGEEDETEEEEQGVLLKDAAQVKTLVSKMKGANIITEHPTEIDLHKLTDGMDDLGEGEEDESDDDEGSEVDEMDEEDEDDDDDEEENQETMRTFSKEKVDGQVEKGKAVKDQLALWDQVLEGRIKLQRALVTANQLPQPETYPEFKKRGGAEFAGALKNSHKAIKALQRSLLELQDQLLFQNPETRPIALGKTWGAETRGGDDNEDISEEEELEAGPPKRKLEMAEYPDVMAKRFAAFQPYRDATLQKWHDKTRLAGGGKGSKGFTAFDRSILTQVEQVLMDNERLVRRTQTRRSDYRVLGKREVSAPAPTTATTTIEDGGGEETEPLAKANAHLKDLDEDVFDDDDFYHQLLRELIERKTSAADPNDQVAMGRQWLAIQKLRSRIKKKVDTKASKGRKVRFNVHSKLVSFMAPVDHSPVNDEARTELYRCLFGNNPSSVRD